MRYLLPLFLAFLMPAALQSQQNILLTPFERSNGNASATFAEVITWYQQLDSLSPLLHLQGVGRSDAGPPIPFVRIDRFPDRPRHEDKRVFVLINNGIHPGEPCGIDASMMIARELVTDSAWLPLLDKVVIGIIPVYNIGGALNRSCCTRASQIGPEEQGFRGNATHLDLNRDFMKMDAHNTWAFAEIFHSFLPDLFLDTHTTNGADYQAPMTYIATQPDKLEPEAAECLRNLVLPELLRRSEENNLMLLPYINIFDGPPENGMAAFLDLPRYASGYTSLFQTIGFISEAHMLKPFDVRVEATYQFIQVLLELAAEYREAISLAVATARSDAAQSDSMAISWTLDDTRRDSVMFHGYFSSLQPGALTGAPRLSYDRSQPFSRFIPYFPHYLPSHTVEVPDAYLVPQAWTEIVDRLKANKVDMERLERDTLLTVEVYRLKVGAPGRMPYEGHYYHRELETTTHMEQVQFRAGDYVVMTGQWRTPFVVHALEPMAADSWFRWNFFDRVLMQKEYFSDYLFEATAVGILANDPELKADFELKKLEDPAFAADSDSQLEFVYKRSAYYEEEHLRYPVARWNW